MVRRSDLARKLLGIEQVKKLFHPSSIGGGIEG